MILEYAIQWKTHMHVWNDKRQNMIPSLASKTSSSVVGDHVFRILRYR